MNQSSLFPLPPQGHCRIKPKPNRLDTDQKHRMYDEMLGHFSAPGLALDNTMATEGGLARGKGTASKVPLNEEEKKYLVSLRFSSQFPTGLIRR